MGRLHRVVIEGFVHVTMRVISGELLFRDGKDAARLLLIAGVSSSEIPLRWRPTA